jgi:iron complex outermembrane recepter protein
MRSCVKGVLSSAILAALTMTAPALAQTTAAGAPPENARNDAIELDTIVVTSRKRSEQLQKVAAAISAFSKADIEAKGVQAIGDVAKQTTGLNFSPIFGSVVATPIIRGSAQTFGAPNVGVFLDGVYLTGKAAIDLALADLERIEVVKGPQSALYGRNTFAGAINYVTKQPSFTPVGSVRVGFGDFGLIEGLASYAGPISEAIAFRVAGHTRKHNGYYTSSLDRGEIDFEDSKGFSADLSYVSDFGLDVTARASYNDDNNGQPASAVVRANGLARTSAIIPPSTGLGLLQSYLGQLPDRPSGRRLSVNTDNAGELNDYGYREQTSRLSVQANYAIDAATLTGITAWSSRDTEYQFDGDNTVCDRLSCPNFGPPIAGNTSRIATSSEDGVTRDFSQELRLSSADDGPLTWLIGAYYYRTSNKAVQRSLSPINGAPTFGFPFLGNRTQSNAIFGALNYKFTDQFGLRLEARSEREKQAFVQYPTKIAGVPASSTSLLTFDLRQNFSFFTPKIVADYQANDDVLVYVSAAKGVKSGGFNTNLRIQADQRRYGEESSVNYELGAKLDWLDGRVRTNAALFRTNWKDQQVACQNPVTAGGTSTQRTYVCNVGQSRIYGLELDTQAKISTDWTAAFGYTYTNAQFTKFVDDSLNATLAAAGQGPYNFVGRSLPYVPRSVFFASLNADAELGDTWRWFGNLALNRQSKQYIRADNLAFIRGRTLANLRFGLKNENWTLSAAIENLADDDSAVTGVRFFDATNFSVPAPLITWSNPRQYSVSAQYRF